MAGYIERFNDGDLRRAWLRLIQYERRTALATFSDEVVRRKSGAKGHVQLKDALTLSGYVVKGLRYVRSMPEEERCYGTTNLRTHPDKEIYIYTFTICWRHVRLSYYITAHHVVMRQIFGGDDIFINVSEDDD